MARRALLLTFGVLATLQCSWCAHTAPYSAMLPLYGTKVRRASGS